MTRNLTLLLIVGVLVAFAGQAEARRLRAGDAVPFSHRPCSVLDGEPCTPSTCSVFDHGPCIPEIDYPIGQNLQVTVLSVPPGDQQALYRRPDHDLDTIGDLFATLRSCWSPPATDECACRHADVGDVLVQHGGHADRAAARDLCQQGCAAGHARHLSQGHQRLARCCLPLKLTKGLGGAVAGRPIMIRYVDNRELEKQSGK
jgi:hypothetical protein